MAFQRWNNSQSSVYINSFTIYNTNPVFINQPLPLPQPLPFSLPSFDQQLNFYAQARVRASFIELQRHLAHASKQNQLALLDAYLVSILNQNYFKNKNDHHLFLLNVLSLFFRTVDKNQLVLILIQHGQTLLHHIATIQFPPLFQLLLSELGDLLRKGLLPPQSYIDLMWGQPLIYFLVSNKETSAALFENYVATMLHVMDEGLVQLSLSGYLSFFLNVKPAASLGHKEKELIKKELAQLELRYQGEGADLQEGSELLTLPNDFGITPLYQLILIGQSDLLKTYCELLAALGQPEAIEAMARQLTGEGFTLLHALASTGNMVILSQVIHFLQEQLGAVKMGAILLEQSQTEDQYGNLPSCCNEGYWKPMHYFIALLKFHEIEEALNYVDTLQDMGSEEQKATLSTPFPSSFFFSEQSPPSQLTTAEATIESEGTYLSQDLLRTLNTPS
jgi:hypothetical protein